MCMKFNIVADNKIINCDILFTFRDDINSINYIVYTDGTKDIDGDEHIYASRYIIEDNNYILKPTENDYEWNLIDNMIESRCREYE